MSWGLRSLLEDERVKVEQLEIKFKRLREAARVAVSAYYDLDRDIAGAIKVLAEEVKD